MGIFSGNLEISERAHHYTLMGMFMTTVFTASRNRIAAPIAGLSTFVFYNMCVGALYPQTVNLLICDALRKLNNAEQEHLKISSEVHGKNARESEIPFAYESFRIKLQHFANFGSGLHHNFGMGGIFSRENKPANLAIQREIPSGNRK